MVEEQDQLQGKIELLVKQAKEARVKPQQTKKTTSRFSFRRK